VRDTPLTVQGPEGDKTGKVGRPSCGVVDSARLGCIPMRQGNWLAYTDIGQVCAWSLSKRWWTRWGLMAPTQRSTISAVAAARVRRDQSYWHKA